MAVGDKKTLVVYGVYKTGAAVVMDNSKLTFNSGTAATAKVEAGGVVTALETGTTEITVQLINNPGSTVIASGSALITVA